MTMQTTETEVDEESESATGSGIIDNASVLLGVEKSELITRLNHNVMILPLDKEGKVTVKFMPGNTVEQTLEPSEVMVIGKMPNQEEINKGYLQCGKMGELWKPYMAGKGLKISNWFQTNVCNFKVPDHLAGKGGLKLPYMKECQVLLEAAIKRIKPKYVLLFGADALKGFVRCFDPKLSSKLKFANCRGTILEFGDIKAVVAISPSQVLKVPESKEEFLVDLDLFAELVATGTRSQRKPPVINLIDNLTDLEEWATSIDVSKKRNYAIDLEWGAGNKLRTMQISDKPNDCVVIHFAHENMVQTEIGENYEAAFEWLAYVLKGPNVGIIGHNVRGDIKVLRQFGFDLMPEFIQAGFDTMLGYHLYPGNETLDKQLELVAIKMLNVDRYDKPLRDWCIANNLSKDMLGEIGYGTVPDEILIPYAAMDAICTYELYLMLVPMLKEKNVWNLYANIIHPVNLPVLEMEEEGITVDQQRLCVLSDLFNEKQGQLIRKLQAMINWGTRTLSVTKTKRGKEVVEEVEFEGFNPDSIDHVKEILFGHFKVKDGKTIRKSPEDAIVQNLTPVKSTDGSDWATVSFGDMADMYSPSTDAESLGILSGENEFAKVLQQYRFCSQIVKNFLRSYTVDPSGKTVWDGGGIGGNLGEDGKLHARFRLTLETGRYATSPNLQNWPKRQEKELNKIFSDDHGKLDPRFTPIRSMLIAPPGFVFVEADWNQAELWTLGYVANDQHFIDVIRTSDVHTTMLRKMFADMEYKGKHIRDFSVDELNKMRKTPEHKFIDQIRVSAKTTVFGGELYGTPK